jgi:peptide/nickel transport system permease protein
VGAAPVRGTVTDRMLIGWTLVVSAVPDYLIILLAWIYFTLHLGWFPDIGYVSPFVNPIATVHGMLLPWLVMGFTGCSGYARFTRGQMVETLSEDYIRTAHAKGLGQSKVLFKHALRAAIVPVVTIFGLDFAFLLGGVIFTERIFGIDGIGSWSLSAIASPMDLQVLSATVLLSAVAIVVANLLVDVIYGILDPRVVVA